MFIPYVFILSIAHQNGLNMKCLKNLHNEQAVGEIVLMSKICHLRPFLISPFLISNKINKCISLRFNLYKRALKSLHDNHVPNGFLESPPSIYAGFDNVANLRWRANHVLDFIQSMKYAQLHVPKGEIFLHLESNVKLLPEFMPDLKSVPLPFSCYYPYGADKTAHEYGGSGASCFVFQNDESVDRVIQCALSHHLLQRLGLIVSECFRTMKAYHVSQRLV